MEPVFDRSGRARRLPIVRVFSSAGQLIIRKAALEVHAEPGFADDPGAAVLHYVQRHLGPLSADQHVIVEHAILGELDDLGETGELEQERLQMAMDQRAKALEAMSNIEKKISETDTTLVQNMR